MNLTIELEQEDDGRWIAEVAAIPGVMVYGNSREEALSQVRALALRVLADTIEQQGDRSEAFHHIAFVAA